MGFVWINPAKISKNNVDSAKVKEAGLWLPKHGYGLVTRKHFDKIIEISKKNNEVSKTSPIILDRDPLTVLTQSRVSITFDGQPCSIENPQIQISGGPSSYHISYVEKKQKPVDFSLLGAITIVSHDAANTATTSIGFSMGNAAKINIAVYDALGRVVATPVINKEMSVGQHAVEFSVKLVPPGIYFCVMHANGNWVDSQKIIVKGAN